MTVIVMNDRGYGVIKRIQDVTAQGRRFFADLQGPDSAACATGGHSVLEGAERRCIWRVRWQGIAHKGLGMVEGDMNESRDFLADYPFNQPPRRLMRHAAWWARLLLLASLLSEDRAAFPALRRAGAPCRWHSRYAAGLPAGERVILAEPCARTRCNRDADRHRFVFGYLGGAPLPFAETHPAPASSWPSRRCRWCW